jgi:hypothetical protein
MKKNNLILTAMLAIALCFTACSNDDDNGQDINLLKQKVKESEARLRASLNTAKTTPGDLSTLFDSIFRLEATNMGNELTNIFDTAKVVGPTVDRFVEHIPTHNNIPNLKILKTDANTLILDVAALKAAEAQH